MFAGIPDFRAELVRGAETADEAWIEWHWTGTRSDGSRLDARGVCIFGVQDKRVAWGRLYMEDVEAGAGIDAAVTALARRRAAPP
jgi:hypothetical protein